MSLNTIPGKNQRNFRNISHRIDIFEKKNVLFVILQNETIVQTLIGTGGNYFG